MTKPFRRYQLLLALTLLSLSATVVGRGVPATNFAVKEYEEFHDVLHPLEHEALPAKDFKRIRANAEELIKRGDAIVKLGVPAGTAEKNVPEFRKKLDEFKESLAKFGKDAKTGTDQQLAESFSAVHDSFEMLWGMVPR